MERSRRSQLSAELGQPASVLLVADPAWPFETVASALRSLGYTGRIARSHEEARRHLSAADRRVDAVVVCTSTGGEGGLQLAIEAATARPELRILVILDLERRAAPVVIAWRLARLPNPTSMIELAASPERIVSRLEALLSYPAPLPRPTPVDPVAQAAGPARALPG